ncbi:MAG: hypothetical protein HRU20_12605 [Pseudomonadales bacterium]|nr:hypothetical protein [Pseudomonadales bacterium]
MADIIDFKSAAKNIQRKRAEDSKKSILCLEGHHKWQASKKKPFENKQGRLVTVYICKNCQREKTVLS